MKLSEAYMAKESSLTIRISDEDKTKLKELAEKRDMSVSEFLVTSALAYDPGKTSAKKVPISFFHIKGSLNVSVALENVDGQIAAVARFCRERVPISGLFVVVSSKFEIISSLTNIYTTVPMMVRLIATLSEKDQQILYGLMEEPYEDIWKTAMPETKEKELTDVNE